MVLYYDIVPDAVDDHDDWHTHEHFPERLAIPGFRRASRWLALGSGPRYLVVYEVDRVQVLSDAPYLERLNNPTPWTARMMPNFRGMVRGFCSLNASAGTGLGHALLSIRYSPVTGREAELRGWLAEQVLPGISAQRGLAGAYMLEPAAQPPMTREQAIRGKDAELPCVLLVTGYREEAIERVATGELSITRFEAHGATPVSVRARYRLDLSASAGEGAS